MDAFSSISPIAGAHATRESRILRRTPTAANIKRNKPADAIRKQTGQYNPASKPIPPISSRTPVSILSPGNPNRKNSLFMEEEARHRQP